MPDHMPAREHGVIKCDCEHMRFDNSALVAGKDIGTGEEASLGGRRPQGSSFSIEFLKPLGARHTWGDTPRLVLDNLIVHKSKAVKTFPAAMPGRFGPVSTPVLRLSGSIWQSGFSRK